MIDQFDRHDFFTTRMVRGTVLSLFGRLYQLPEPEIQALIDERSKTGRPRLQGGWRSAAAPKK
jgi:hypothetical protein